MVAPKRPHGRRLLLPTEIELCKLLNLTEDEYWYFVDTTAAYNGQRPKGYELIPDIRCDPVSAFLATTYGKALLINIGISLIRYALTDKPKDPQQGGSIRTADAIGNTRFTPRAAFDSVQELAAIGDAIPLVFADFFPDMGGGYGGVRVNSQLLWSKISSGGRFQQLKGLFLFSYGILGDYPSSFAVGDTLLKTYNQSKYNIYFRKGENLNSVVAGDNRVKKSDKIEGLAKEGSNNDPFIVGINSDSGLTTYSKAFSGTRNPETQSKFGVYSVIPNSQTVKLPYELIREARGSSKTVIKDIMRKRRKVEFTNWPVRAGIIALQDKNGQAKSIKKVHTATKGWTITYQILGKDAGEDVGLQTDIDTGQWESHEPHGVDDINNYTISVREQLDSAIVVGEQYLFGTALFMCTGSSSGDLWTVLYTKEYYFECIEEGEIEYTSTNLSVHADNPKYFLPSGSSNRKNKSRGFSLNDSNDSIGVLYRQLISGGFIEESINTKWPRGTRDLYHPYEIYTGQKVAIAVITNNRRCDATEIGLKSKVYKRIQCANVNTQPDEDTLEDIFEERSQIQLGQVNIFARRISLFMLQARAVGTDSWTDLINKSVSGHSGLFAVKGNSPDFLYNSITIVHPTKDSIHEFRLKPYPGNYITNNNGRWDKRFNLLSSRDIGDIGNNQNCEFRSNNYVVRFAGDKNYTITKAEACNTEWQLGTITRTATQTLVSVKTTDQRTEWYQDESYEPEAISETVYQQYWTDWRLAVSGDKALATMVLFNKNNEPYGFWLQEGTFSTYPYNLSVAPQPGERYQWTFYWSHGHNLPGMFVQSGQFDIPQGDLSALTPQSSGNRAAPVWKEGVSVLGNSQTIGGPSSSITNQIEFTFDGWSYKIADPSVYFHPPDDNHPNGNPHAFYFLRRQLVETSSVQEIGTASYKLLQDWTWVNVNKKRSNDPGDGNLQVQIRTWYLDKNEFTGYSPNYIHKIEWNWSAAATRAGSGYQNGQKVKIPFQKKNGASISVEVTLQITEDFDEKGKEENLNPFDALADWNSYEGDENSNRNEPEHEVVFVNEYVRPSTNGQGTELPAKYTDLAYAGLSINSSDEWVNFKQFSAYFKKGIKIYDLLNSSIDNNDDISWAPDASSNLFPEIAYSLLASPKIGAGKLVGVDSIDFRAMKNAADYCRTNRFFWDGVISSKLNLRSFIFEHAGYCLLDFTIIGGKFSLKPAVPVNSQNEIDPTIKPDIKCLFTDGNIKDLKVSFLSPEERQPFQAVVLYRAEDIARKGFPETRSIVIRETDVKILAGATITTSDGEDLPVERFDLSPFCTSRAQALSFAFFAIKSRRLVDHGLIFQTAPQYVQGLEPGDYFRLVSEVTHTSRFRNGAKLDDGTIISKDNIDSDVTVYYWAPGTEGVNTGTMSSIPNGVLFTVKNNTTENKIYKCETISYGEDGLIEVSGSFAPVETRSDIKGRLSVLQGWSQYGDKRSSDYNVSSDFTIIEN